MKYKIIKAAFLGLFLSVSSMANAALIINIYESGNNVELAYSGSINLDSTLGFIDTSEAVNGYLASEGAIGISNAAIDYYEISASSWTPFGTSGFGTWDAASGDALMLSTDPYLALASGYISGETLSGKATKVNSSFAALGFTVGSFATQLVNGDCSEIVTVNDSQVPAQLVNGGCSETITVNVRQVPAPNALAILALGLIGLGARRFKK
nr:PEP-CTERM sorting domain-containing protein [uncultured Glaciecola sp.]